MCGSAPEQVRPAGGREPIGDHPPPADDGLPAAETRADMLGQPLLHNNRKPSTDETGAFTPVELRVVAGLERRGFGSPLARWMVNNIRTRGVQWCVDQLCLTIYDVEQTAKVDEHNAVIMEQVWQSTFEPPRSTSKRLPLALS